MISRFSVKTWDDDGYEVIELERDAGTMTEFSRSLETNDNLLPKRRKSNFLTLWHRKQRGFNVETQLNSQLNYLKTFRLRAGRTFRTTHKELHISDCLFIRRGFDSNSVIGLWTGNQFDSIMYKLVFRLTSKYSSVKDEIPVLVQSTQQCGPFFSKTNIIDMSESYFEGLKCILYSGLCYTEGMVPAGSTVLCYFTEPNSSNGKQYVTDKAVNCCSGSRHGDTFATGTDDGVFIFQESEYQHLNGNEIYSTEFDNSGNMLYCGSDSPGILIFDRRELFNPPISIPFGTDAHVTETKLLSDGCTMVVSDDAGNLSKVDFRNKEVVTTYENHCGSNRRVPFSLSEDVDLVCATGTDKVTRLWSLSTGEHLHSIEPRYSDETVHSCLLYEENRWAVALFQRDKAYFWEGASE